MTTGDRTGNIGLKLQQGGLKMDIRQNLLMMRALRHWNWLSREVVDSSPLEMFKSSLDRHLTGVF